MKLRFGGGATMIEVFMGRGLGGNLWAGLLVFVLLVLAHTFTSFKSTL